MISIVMPALNEERYIAKAISSLQDQKTAAELIVIDNESTDKTAEIAKGLGAKVITAPRGKLNARDAGIRAAEGDIIVAVDADSYYPQGWLERLVSHFNKLEVVAVGGHRSYDRGFHWVSLLPISRFFGGNSAFRKQAYLDSGGFNLDTNQFSLVAMTREEEIRFKHRLKKFGKVIIDKKAKIISSSRRFNDPDFKRQVKSGERF